MIRTDGINLDDIVTESSRLVDDELHKGVRCRFSGQKLKLAVYGN